MLTITSADDTITVTIDILDAADGQECEVDDHAIPAGSKIYKDESDVILCADHFLLQLDVLAST